MTNHRSNARVRARRSHSLHDYRMRSRLCSCRLFMLALLFAASLLLPQRAGAEDPTATATETRTPPLFFNSQLLVKPLSSPVGPLQDLQGRVVARNGSGIDGVRVRASTKDWQAFETTQDGGKFKFSLTNGSYAIRLVDMMAGEAEVTVDGKSELQVQFNEADRPFGVAIATSTSASPTETATATATETPTPSATSTSTSTPNAEGTSVSETTGGDDSSANTPGAATSTLPSLGGFDPAPLLRVFVYGGGLGGALILVVLLVVLVRRL